MKNIRIHLIIEGRVQGVWFRDSTRNEALHLGVFGWVRNLPNGNVEVLAEGPEDKVKKLVQWCHNGPPAASVTRVQESQDEWRGEFEGFEIAF